MPPAAEDSIAPRAPRSTSQASPTRIPLHAHFIWLGTELPYVHRLALRSAAQNGGFERVTLHCESALLGTRTPAELAEQQIELRLIDDTAFAGCPDPAGMAGLFAALIAPAARANVLRVALLHAEGGVYLDSDTVTVRSFAPLCQSHDLFCGAEHLVYPASVRSAKSPTTRALAQARSGVRKGLSVLPSGYRWFRRIADWYPVAVNNAVIGAAPRHPLLADMMQAMLRVPEHERQVRFAFGTHLLQRTLVAHEGAMHVYPPRYFYPLGPEISAHWFKLRRHVRLEHALSEDTVCVHWYASVKTRHAVQQIDREYIRTHAASQLYSALVARYVQL